MRKQIIILLAGCLASIYDLSAQTTFQVFGNISMRNAYYANEMAVLQTHDGNYCVAGTALANNGDIYLMKLNGAGDTIWTKTFGGNFDDILMSAEQTADSGFILAGMSRSFSMGNEDAYLIRTDADGNLLWSKNYGGYNSDLFTSVYPTEDKGFIACGSTSTFGVGDQDMYLVKLDSAGAIQWTKTLGGSGWDRGNSVRPTLDKGYIITGATASFTATSGRIYLVKTDASGNAEWSKIYGGVMGESGNCVRQCSDSSFVITGNTNSFGAGRADAFLLKTDAMGNVAWMKTYGGTDEEVGVKLEVTNDNGFIVIGGAQSFTPDFSSSKNTFIFRTDSNGDTLWTSVYTNIANENYDVKQTKDSGFVIATSGRSIAIIKTDASGHALCNRYNTSTKVYAANPVLLTGVVESSGGAENSATTLTRYISDTIWSSCSATNIKNTLSAERLDVSVYPNPFIDEINFSAPGDGAIELTLYDLYSKKILNETFNNSIKLNLSVLSNGIYIYEIRNKNNQVQHGKIIKR